MGVFLRVFARRWFIRHALCRLSHMVSSLWMGCCLSARVLEGQPASRICDNEATYAANRLLPMLPPECNLALTPPALHPVLGGNPETATLGTSGDDHQG